MLRVIPERHRAHWIYVFILENVKLKET